MADFLKIFQKVPKSSIFCLSLEGFKDLDHFSQYFGDQWHNFRHFDNFDNKVNLLKAF